ncbi:MAG: hypothetical protein KAI35_08325, partial [Desulfobulbaceae bacterium]|nr:hypothetical protein [Desulfobulbaceae bacterium]
ATGMARPTVGVRPDITSEYAGKKSFLRAMQMLYIGASCNDILNRLSEKDRFLFFLIFAPFMESAESVESERIEGISVIRQWEKDQDHFTTVAVPVTAVQGLSCAFSNLPAAISRYLKLDKPSLKGLAFCLRYVPRYSKLYSTVRIRIGRWFIENGHKELALCFMPGTDTVVSGSPVGTLVFQNRMYRSLQLTKKAEDQAGKGLWAESTANATLALKLTPACSPAFLVIADYFIAKYEEPILALCAVEKAMRDGTSFSSNALEKKAAILKALDSPEAEVYEYLLSQCKPLPDWEYYSWSDALPETWKSELKRFGAKPVVNLVVASLGQAVENDQQLPTVEFGRAAALFNEAKTDDDVSRVIDLLLAVCEKHPASAKVYNLIGACYRHLGKYEIALPFLWQALTIEPGYDYALTNLGLCCQSLKLKKAARFYFEHEAVRNSANRWVKESYANFIKN